MAENNRPKLITIENVEILPGQFRNFAGKPDRFNPQGGEGYFNIRLPRDVAEAMLKDGFRVRTLDAREEGDDPSYILKVAVSYKIRPPQVYFIAGGVRTLLDKGAVEIMDHADIEAADIMINPSEWEVNGDTGTKAYLHKLFVTVEQDDLDAKYADIPVSYQQNQDAGSEGVRFE